MNGLVAFAATAVRTRMAVAIAVATLSTPAFPQSQAVTPLDPNQAVAIAAHLLKWNEPTAPLKIVGPIHFVGTEGLAAWLITTGEGHILLNTGMPGSGPGIEASIRALGFNPKDIELLLTSHAHMDHVGGHAHIKRISGARVATMANEVALLNSGGTLDFQYAKISAMAFEPVSTDQVVQDGETLRLGDVAITAHLTPGHTRGSTTWTMAVKDGGKDYTVVFPDGTSVNPGYRLVRDPSYPGIAADYRRTFEVLEALEPDIWLPAHTEFFDFAGKRARAAREGSAAWVDPEGYSQWVARQRRKFEAAIR